MRLARTCYRLSFLLTFLFAIPVLHFRGHWLQKVKITWRQANEGIPVENRTDRSFLHAFSKNMSRLSCVLLANFAGHSYMDWMSEAVKIVWTSASTYTSPCVVTPTATAWSSRLFRSSDSDSFGLPWLYAYLKFFVFFAGPVLGGVASVLASLFGDSTPFMGFLLWMFSAQDLLWLGQNRLEFEMSSTNSFVSCYVSLGFKDGRLRSTFFAAHGLSLPVHNPWLGFQEGMEKKLTFAISGYFSVCLCLTLFNIREFVSTIVVFGNFENASGSSISVYLAIFAHISLAFFRSTQDVWEYETRLFLSTCATSSSSFISIY